MTETSPSALAQSGVQLSFEGLPEATLLAGSSHVLQLVTRHFQRWPFAEHTAEEGRPYFHVQETRRGFEICSEGHTERFDTSVEMLCDLGIDLAEAFIRHHSAVQCLHCSAVALCSEGEERLVLFPNINRAGKSLLAASFLMHDVRLFADDLLAVTEEGEGMSFGLPLRLRLPLPPTSVRLSEKLESMPGHGDGRYHFLYAGEAIAAFGERRPIGAIVLPRRLPEGQNRRPELRRLSPASALQCMAYQFQMREGQAMAIFELARRLCERVPLWILDYDSPEEAAELMVREGARIFTAHTPGEEGEMLPKGYLTESDRLSMPARGRAFPSERNLRWLRAPDMHIHENGAFAYLIPKDQNSIFGVDGIGLAVLAFLAEPLSIAEAAGLLAHVFPQTGRERLESDLLAFFRLLFEQGLIIRAPR